MNTESGFISPWICFYHVNIKVLVYLKYFSEYLYFRQISCFLLNSFRLVSWFHIFKYHIEICLIIEKSIQFYYMRMIHFKSDFYIMNKFSLKLMSLNYLLFISFYCENKMSWFMNSSKNISKCSRPRFLNKLKSSIFIPF